MVSLDDLQETDVLWYASIDSFDPSKVIVVKKETSSDLWAVQVIKTGLVKYVDNEFLFLTEDEAEICSTLLMRKLVTKRNIKNQQSLDDVFNIMMSDNTYAFESILKEIEIRLIKFENESPHLFLKHMMSSLYE